MKAEQRIHHMYNTSVAADGSAQEARQNLRMSDAFSHMVLDSLEDYAIFMTDTGGTIQSWNVGAEQLIGYSANEILGEHASLLFTLADRQQGKAEQELQQAVEQGRARNERWHLRKGSTRFWGSSLVFPVLDELGTLQGFAKIVRDLTERKQTEHNLQYLSTASKMLSSSLDYATTLHRVAELAVPEIADWCSVDMKTRTGIQQLAVAHVDPDKVKWAKELNAQRPPDPDAPTGVPNVLRTGQSEFYPDVPEAMLIAAANEEELALIRKVGFSSIMIVPLTVEGKTIGAITFVAAESKRHYTYSDLAMAEEVASRAALAIANARLYSESQHAVSLRDEFISVASHELKTPVTSLKMYTQGLRKQFERRGEDDIVRRLTKMDAQVDKLTLLITDLLNVSKLQLGKLALHEEAFDLHAVVKEVIESIQPTTKKHRILLKGAIDRSVWGDKDRIGQVVINLLTNAIKYSPHADAVIVRLAAEADCAVVTVQDFGIGIEEQHQGNIFQRFYRVSDPDEKTFPGLGIGLYISNEIIQRHGGIMTVSSQKGAGSVFRFTVPYQGSTTASASAPPEQVE